ncbi:hypothetical protein UCRPC4_g06785 [Phaeomoniella chlamydospora]|uniref:Uncharacterized protein n=1 Tax=Phaeomoniella chlamydospora TaxID=158046 RepID=A0A0G2GB27_PHACM|nr:hypothetical protein UCRPC4_g06785 [Phaeomoniella chlamydospora]
MMLFPPKPPPAPRELRLNPLAEVFLPSYAKELNPSASIFEPKCGDAPPISKAGAQCDKVIEDPYEFNDQNIPGELKIIEADIMPIPSDEPETPYKSERRSIVTPLIIDGSLRTQHTSTLPVDDVRQSAADADKYLDGQEPYEDSRGQDCHHYSYFGHPVYRKNSTNPAHSLFVILAPTKSFGSHLARLDDQMLRQYTVLNEAKKLVDPVGYCGSISTLHLKGRGLIEAVTGEVCKLYGAGFWSKDSYDYDDDQIFEDPMDHKGYEALMMTPINGFFNIPGIVTSSDHETEADILYHQHVEALKSARIARQDARALGRPSRCQDVTQEILDEPVAIATFSRTSDGIRNTAVDSDWAKSVGLDGIFDQAASDLNEGKWDGTLRSIPEITVISLSEVHEEVSEEDSDDNSPNRAHEVSHCHPDDLIGDSIGFGLDNSTTQTEISVEEEEVYIYKPSAVEESPSNDDANGADREVERTLDTEFPLNGSHDHDQQPAGTLEALVITRCYGEEDDGDDYVSKSSASAEDMTAVHSVHATMKSKTLPSLVPRCKVSGLLGEDDMSRHAPQYISRTLLSTPSLPSNTPPSSPYKRPPSNTPNRMRVLYLDEAPDRDYDDNSEGGSVLSDVLEWPSCFTDEEDELGEASEKLPPLPESPEQERVENEYEEAVDVDEARFLGEHNSVPLKGRALPQKSCEGESRVASVNCATDFSISSSSTDVDIDEGLSGLDLLFKLLEKTIWDSEQCREEQNLTNTAKLLNDIEDPELNRIVNLPESPRQENIHEKVEQYHLEVATPANLRTLDLDWLFDIDESAVLEKHECHVEENTEVEIADVEWSAAVEKGSTPGSIEVVLESLILQNEEPIEGKASINATSAVEDETVVDLLIGIPGPLVEPAQWEEQVTEPEDGIDMFSLPLIPGAYPESPTIACQDAEISEDEDLQFIPLIPGAYPVSPIIGAQVLEMNEDVDLDIMPFIPGSFPQSLALDTLDKLDCREDISVFSLPSADEDTDHGTLHGLAQITTGRSLTSAEVSGSESNKSLAFDSDLSWLSYSSVWKYIDDGDDMFEPESSTVKASATQLEDAPLTEAKVDMKNFKQTEPVQHPFLAISKPLQPSCTGFLDNLTFENPSAEHLDFSFSHSLPPPLHQARRPLYSPITASLNMIKEFITSKLPISLHDPAHEDQ